MDNNNRVKPRRESVIMSNQNIGGNFGSKLSFTIGTAYISFGALGLIVGIFNIKKPKFALPTKRLLASFYIKHMTSNAILYANRAGAAALLYSATGWLIAKGFEENLLEYSNLSKNLLIGFSTGLIYKSTRGYRAAMVGALVGMGIIGTMNILTDYLRERDYIKFEMRFDG